MNDEEIRSTIEQIKAQVKANPENKDKSDDEIDELILDSFFKSYTEGKMTKEDLLGLAEAMGYEPDEGFENDPEALDKFEPGEADKSEGGEGGEQLSQSDLEETRTIGEGESAEQFKDKIDEVKEGNPVRGEGGNENEPEANPEANPEGGDEGEDEEEAERKAASELWKMDLSKK